MHTPAVDSVQARAYSSFAHAELSRHELIEADPTHVVKSWQSERMVPVQHPNQEMRSS